MRRRRKRRRRGREGSKAIDGRDDAGNGGRKTGRREKEGKNRKSMLRSIRRGGKKGAEKVLDLIFPRRCPVCDDAVHPSGALICPECAKKVRFVKEPFCMKCGKPLEQAEREYCHDCTDRKHYYGKGLALFEYNSVAASIYRFKYRGRREYAEFYGQCLADRLGDRIRNWRPDALVPVPIHRSKMYTRGYNQAELIAIALGKRINIPVRNLVERCRNTLPQKELDERERQNNLKKAFKFRKNDVKLSTIVIIDDIYTTGSTIDAVALELRKAGGVKIYYVALAIGKGL